MREAEHGLAHVDGMCHTALRCFQSEQLVKDEAAPKEEQEAAGAADDPTRVSPCPPPSFNLLICAQGRAPAGWQPGGLSPSCSGFSVLPALDITLLALQYVHAPHAPACTDTGRSRRPCERVDLHTEAHDRDRIPPAVPQAALEGEPGLSRVRTPCATKHMGRGASLLLVWKGGGQGLWL